jgi:hypothetical protein
VSEEKSKNVTLTMRIRLREFSIPPITDALVLGRKAPIGAEAMSRALGLLNVSAFEQIGMDDDVVENILVRRSMLNKISPDKLVELVLRRVKPFMSVEEVTHLDLLPELTIEEQV